MGDKLSLLVRSVLTSAFVGFCTTVALLAFDMVFRYFSGYPDAAIFNVTSIILMSFFVMVPAGLIFYGFKSGLKGAGSAAYTVFMLIVFAVVIFILSGANIYEHRYSGFTPAQLNSQFHGECIGVGVIMAIMSAIIIPFLYNNKKFGEKVLDDLEWYGVPADAAE